MDASAAGSTANCMTDDTTGIATAAISQSRYQHIDTDKSPVSCCSNMASPLRDCSSASTPSSPPQYSEDMRRNAPPRNLNLLPRQGSASSNKTCEVDLGEEERDTFSPVTNTSCSSNSTHHSPLEAVVAAAVDHNLISGLTAGSTMPAFDNKVTDGSPAATLHHAAAASASKHKLNNGTSCSSSSNLNCLHPSTKEQKQRQNEEIVIMETSSVSSETGSWESVFPHNNAVQSERKDQFVRLEKPLEKDKLLDEHEAEQPQQQQQPHFKECLHPYLRDEATADTSSLIGAAGSGLSMASILRDLNMRDNALTNSGTSACFIDASSLRDEDEVLSFPSMESHQPNEEQPLTNDEEKVASHLNNATKLHDNFADMDNEDDDESPTKKLETFHKLFAKCKTKSKDILDADTAAAATTNSELLQIDTSPHSSSSSHSAENSPQKVSPSSTNNLSDEEKLWKRKMDNPLSMEARKASNLDKDNDATEASISLAADVDSSDSSDFVRGRREQKERKSSAPMHVFPHQLQQFTIHPLSASPKFNQLTHPHNDVSYTTDYSSSSPAPSLAWSEHENRSTNTHRNATQAPHTHGFSESTCILPDTPHNSIVHIENVSSNTSSIHRDYTLSSSLSHQRDSGAYCSDATDSPVPLPRTPKRSKFDEANPIISGGASVKDFCIKQCESPPIKRRTDICPIVSGGFTSLDFEPTRPLDDEQDVELRQKSLQRKANASWVVNMSDCRSERRKSTSSNSSSIAALGDSGKFRERSDSSSSHKSGCGFFVSLDDMDRKPEAKTQPPMSQSYSTPKTAGYFVPLSKSEYQPKELDHALPKATDELTDSAEGDKKNIFSMFIEVGNDKKSTTRKEPFNLAQRLSSSIMTSQKRADEAMRSSASSTETLMSKSGNLKASALYSENEMPQGESKSLDYRCNMDLPLSVAAIRRISQQQRAQSETPKRHSWGNNQAKETAGECKRSASLTANGSDSKQGAGGGLMSIIDKLPLISKASSLSVDSSLSPYDEFTGSKSDMSSSSNNSNRNSMSGGEREEQVVNGAQGRIKKRRRDVQINETFDKSSLASITDGMLSKDTSPCSTTDTDDLTFQQDEEMAAASLANQQTLNLSNQMSTSNRTTSVIMETIIETKETSSPKKTLSGSSSGHTMESLHATIEKQKMLLETVNENTEKSSFVKLSDMDKPIKLEGQSPERMMSKSVGGNNSHRPMSRLYGDVHGGKNRPHSWGMTRSTGNSLLNITNSVDNLRSLSRIFPHFSKEFSNSMPTDITIEQTDYIQTDLSADSSLASSFSRSGMDESSISCRQPRRLGEDLLKMFLQEIATDMIVEVHGRRLKAHKCILRSRCQYFAAMLAGSNSSSVVSLQGYSYSAVHFALCHIYSGASHPPDGISLMELAGLADLLGLEGLKEVTAHALKVNYCHNFHKPCSGCIDGILQVLPVALNHALDDLYRKCLRWTCRHYMKVWPTRQFAQMSPDILARCRQQIVAYLTSETVLDTVLDCDNLLDQLATYRWGGVCESLVRDILDAAYAYIGDHFASLIASDAFLSLGHDRSCHIPRLEGLLLRTAATLTPDQACRSYQRVTRLNTVLQAKMIQMPGNLGVLAKELQGLQEEELDWDTEYIRLVSAILSAVEQSLIRQCSKAMRTTAWQRMDLELRKKVQTLARLTEPLDLKRGKPVSKAFSFGGSTRNQDLHQVKLAIQAHSKRSMAQDTQMYKATQTTTHDVQTTERGVQASHDLREGTSKILKSNSRAHVPQSHRATSQSVTCSERNSINTHRRTQSEAPAMTAAAQKKAAAETSKPAAGMGVHNARLQEVRPRYLEPRKARSSNITNGPNTAVGPIRSATTASMPGTTKAKLGVRQISSSESSRTSSPATRKVLSTARVGTRTSNMSLDNLSSPMRRGKAASRGKSSDNERFSDTGGADSMKSSIITNKTVSQESLSRSNQHLYKRATVATINKQNLKDLEASGNKKPQARPNSLKPNVKLLQQANIASNGSSPSSVTTNKSAASRLSSVSSTHSARDLYKYRSISVPGQQENNNNKKAMLTAGQTTSQVKRSFLSAKSREILAKRAEKNKKLASNSLGHLAANSSGDEKSSVNSSSTGILRSASHSAVPVAIIANNAFNRNSLPPSNIPTRRPNTLQLRKTNGYNRNNANNNNINLNKSNGSNNLISKTKLSNASANGAMKAAQAVKQKLELLIDATSSSVQHEQHVVVVEPMRIESKLERSSTFSKDASDLDFNELQIIE